MPRLLALILTPALALAACGSTSATPAVSSEPSATAAPSQQPTETPASPDWQSYTAEDGSFTADFPDDPLMTNQTLEGIEVTTWTAASDAAGSCNVSRQKFEPGFLDEGTEAQLADFLRGFVSTYAKGWGPVSDEKVTTFQGRPARTAQVSAGSLVHEITVLVNGNDVWVLLVIRDADGPSGAAHFFESFRLPA